MESTADGMLSRERRAIWDERSRQLDLFRGMAAIFMIVNHAGYKLLETAASSGGWSGWLVFVGSAAPALFFFATGVGAGYSSAGREALPSALRKVVLLLLADMLMNWSGGTLLAFDFFGFAAVTTFTLFLIRQVRRPVPVAAILFVLVVVARFGVASFARGRIPADSVLAFVTGIAPVRHVSYPLGPWLSFPLLGFLVGRRWRKSAASEEAWTMGSVAGLCLAASAALAAHGATVFRWGSVSIAYFLCAIGIVAVAWLCTRWLARIRPSLTDALALRGPASLLIVPLHYGALGALGRLSRPPWALGAWAIATALLVLGVLLLSRTLIAGARHIAKPGTILQIFVVAATCVSALIAFFYADPLLRLEICSAGEVVIALVLLWSSNKNAASTRVGSSDPVAFRA